MGKIFGYELRRLLGNKFSAGLAVLTLAYSYWVMNEEVILGIANTAPFSPWSFGVYLGRVMPVLAAALLCSSSPSTTPPRRSGCGRSSTRR